MKRIYKKKPSAELAEFIRKEKEAGRGISLAMTKKCGENWHTEKAKEFARDLIRTLETPVDGKLREFSQVMIDLLKKKFKL